MYDLLIVGGGAAGMMAAVQAGRRGLRVLLAEKGGEDGAEAPDHRQRPLQRHLSRPAVGTDGEHPPQPPFSSTRPFPASTTRTPSAFSSRPASPSKPSGEPGFSPVGQGVRHPRRADAGDEKGGGFCSVTGEVSELLLQDAKSPAPALPTAGRRKLPLSSSRPAAPPIRRPVPTAAGISSPKRPGTRSSRRAASLIPMLTAEKDPRDMMGLSLKNVRLTLLENGKAGLCRAGGDALHPLRRLRPAGALASAHIRPWGRRSTPFRLT